MDSPLVPRLALVIEDNPTNLRLTQIVLERAGYRVDGARSAEAALERLALARPDIILMDIRLPGMDGLMLTRSLRTEPATASIPIVALTAHAMKEDQARALAAGCDSYIAKPINTRTLAEELATILEACRSRSERKG